MSNIYIIAGPPGIGKSTLGHRFIPSDLDILNEDEMRFRYKAKGYADYNEYAIHRVKDIIRRKLIKNEDFALELNLGFAHQYEYALAIKRFRNNVVLFFTDDLELCKNRAKERFENGRHLVKPETINEMYGNTLPLLKANFQAIDNLMLLDANGYNGLNPVAQYHRKTHTLDVLYKFAFWFEPDLRLFIQEYINIIKSNL